MSKRASDDVLGVHRDPNNAQALPGSGAKMELRQNALTLRRAQGQVTTITIAHTLSPYSQSIN